MVSIGKTFISQGCSLGIGALRVPDYLGPITHGTGEKEGTASDDHLYICRIVRLQNTVGILSTHLSRLQFGYSSKST
jgi:hypothetical protein